MLVLLDVVVAVAVSISIRSCNHLCLISFQTHPSQNMIATGSIDSDLAIRIWYDRGGNT